MRRGDLPGFKGHLHSGIRIALGVLGFQRLQFFSQVDPVDGAGLQLHDLGCHIGGGRSGFKAQQLADRFVCDRVLVGGRFLPFLEALVLSDARGEGLHDLLLGGVLAQPEQLCQFLQDVHIALSSFKIF